MIGSRSKQAIAIVVLHMCLHMLLEHRRPSCPALDLRMNGPKKWNLTRHALQSKCLWVCLSWQKQRKLVNSVPTDSYSFLVTVAYDACSGRVAYFIPIRYHHHWLIDLYMDRCVDVWSLPTVMTCPIYDSAESIRLWVIPNQLCTWPYQTGQIDSGVLLILIEVCLYSTVWYIVGI